MANYYSLDAILEVGAIYNIILGPRSNGKTYSVLRHCLRNYFESGEQFAYIRRYKESIAPTKLRTLFEPHYGYIEDMTGGKYNHVKIYKQAFWLCHLDDDGTILETAPKPFAIAVALSTQENDKGSDLGFCRYLIFDEFIARDRYLSDEFTRFMNCVSTLVRDRAGTKIFLIANPVSKFCPYFEEFGIDINTIKQGTITTIKYEGTDMKTAFEYCDMVESSEKPKSEYFAFENAKVKMITAGTWELDEVAHLPSGVYGDAENLMTCYIEFSNKIFAAEILKYNGVLLLFYRPANEVKKNHYVFTSRPSLSQYEINKFPKNRLTEIMAAIIRTGREFYSDNTVGNFILGWKLEVMKNK